MELLKIIGLVVVGLIIVWGIYRQFTGKSIIPGKSGGGGSKRGTKVK